MQKILLAVGLSACLNLQAQNPLVIPPVLTGTTFNLNVQDGITQFYTGINTPTYGVNGALLAPTLIFNKWDWVTLNVTNNLTGSGNSTTMHWHGIRLPAVFDGGPHQVILQGNTWSPQFQIVNDAGTYWYHPHGEKKTDRHVSKGLAGMIIIKDSAEAALTLPRTYGVDDFPLIVQTKCFDVLNQIAIATAYDTVPMVNGLVNPVMNAPAQVVRFRLLNGASERSFLFGFSNNMNFHLIANDGGLLDTTRTLNRLRLSNGERAEILLDLTGHLNDTIYLMSYGSELAHGIMGADSVGDAAHQIPNYYSNFLNGADYNLLQIIVTAQTGTPVTTVAATLVNLNPWSEVSATVHRSLVFDTLSDGFTTPDPAEGPFGINGEFFHMDSINETVYLNTVEIWTLYNKTMVAHPFHIHDVNFFILDVNGGPVPDYERGKKDVVLVMPGDSIRFITKFEDFANDTVPYMFHCHILHHEDDGMMGSFRVIDTTSIGINELATLDEMLIYPNPADDFINIILPGNNKTSVSVFNSLGELTYITEAVSNLRLQTSGFPEGIYFLKIVSYRKTYRSKFVKL